MMDDKSLGTEYVPYNTSVPVKYFEFQGNMKEKIDSYDSDIIRRHPLLLDYTYSDS